MRSFTSLMFITLLLLPNAGNGEDIDPGTQSKGSSSLSANELSTWEDKPRSSALALQLILDDAGFGPGRLDGYFGEFSKKALKRWNSARPDEAIELVDGEPPSILIESWGKDLWTEYEVSSEDLSDLASVPDAPEEQAEMEQLPYTSILELVAEKFHCSIDYLKEINHLESGGDLKAGDRLKVPAVSRPFDLNKVEKLAKSGSAVDDVTSKSRDDAPDKGKKVADNDKLSVMVDLESKVVELWKDEKIQHSYPISVGDAGNSSPPGEWKVSIVSWMPEFRYDEKMLKEGNRGSEAHMLPPGPNNPVGIVWIGLSADGIGLHGTPSPDMIGRNKSHGCIRLSNWDALELGQLMAKGTPVTIR